MKTSCASLRPCWMDAGPECSAVVAHGHRQREAKSAICTTSCTPTECQTMSNQLQGVIAAIATAVDETGAPDCARSTALARYLLANGGDGLNVLGTTGEATSFSLEERKRVMTAYRDAGLPMDRLMVGTGAASAADAVALTRHAAERGFAGALVLPPFYYKGVPDDGLYACIEAIVTATAEKPIPIYLYHFPSQSGLPWHVALLRRLTAAFGARIVGLKDSSGDLPYAREAATV